VIAIESAEEIQPENLSGQVAVVIGGGRGLGRVFARALAASGASVAVIARSEEQFSETVSDITDSGGLLSHLPAM
jgi:NAD(P)-dependent dehydrogenase (short-subunit alcohol dehydrogenase family)